MTSLTKLALKDAVNKIIRVHENKGFQIKCIDADVQLEYIHDEIEGVEIGIVDANEYAE